MYALQNFYSLILNPIGRITEKIDEKVRNAVITLCCFFLAGFFIAYSDKYVRLGLYLNHTHNNIICGVVLIILVLCSIKGPLRKVVWDPVLFYTFFTAGGGIVAVSMIHPVGSGYRSFGLMMMFGFPCLYYVWNNRRDYNTLFIRLSVATGTAGLALFLYCIKAASKGELDTVDGMVNAFFINPNLFSMVGMVMVCSAVYMFAVYKENNIGFMFAAVTFAVGWTIVMLGSSRLSVLVGAGGIFALFVYSIKTERMIMPAKSRLLSHIRSLIVAGLMIGMVLFGLTLTKWNASVMQEKTASVNIETQEDAAEVDGNTATPEDPALNEDGDNATIEKFSTKGKDLNTYTSGRIRLWRNYSKHLNLLGNDISMTDYAELTGSYEKHAHNNFLEYGYRCGIPVACLHIFLELYAGIICVIFLFGKKYRDPYYLFAVVFMICYAVESMFDIATLPFERYAPFFFYMALIPVFGKKENEQTVDKIREDH